MREYFYLIAVLFAFLLAAELSIRMYHWLHHRIDAMSQTADAPLDSFGPISYRAHPFLHYVPNPQSPGIDGNYFRQVPSVQNPKHVIVSLGESSTYGHGVGASATYSARLQEILNHDGASYSVLNGGVPGWEVVHELARYIFQLRHLKPRADMLVIYAGYNDARSLLSSNSSAPAYEDVLRPFDGDVTGWWRYSKLLVFVASHLRQLSCQWFGDDLGIRVHLNDFAFVNDGMQCRTSFPNAPINEVRLARFHRDLQTLVRLAKQDGVAVLLVKQDTPLFENRRIGPAFFQARAVFDQVGAEEGVPVIDMHDYMSSKPENFLDEIHPSVKGHEAIAQALAPVVRSILAATR